MKKQPPFKVGQFVVDPQRYCMRGAGHTIDVSKRQMQLLSFLAARQGEVVTKDELLTHIWSDVIVSDDTIRKTISDLRRLFQHNDGHIEIESVRGVGYRLLTSVGPLRETQSGGNSHLLWSIGILLALALAVLSYWSVTVKQSHFQMASRLNQSAVSTAVRWSGDGEKVSFVKKEDGKQRLVLQKEQFHEVPLLESTSTLHPEAAFSPDGEELIYLDREPAGKVIRHRNLTDLSEQTLFRVNNTPALSSLDWSSEGDQIVWSEAQTGRPFQLLVSSVQDTDQRRVLTYPPADYIGDMQARFSPSGQQLCFIRYSSAVSSYNGILPGLGQLYIKDLASGAEIPLLEREMVLGGVSWLDEHTLIYIARDFYTFGIHTINLNTRQKETIHTSALALRHLGIWKDFIWTEEWQEQFSFMQLEADETEPSEAFGTPLKCWHPTYSPDGTQLAYVTKGEQAYELRLRHLATQEEEVLFAAPMLIQAPQWSPASNALVFMLEGSEAGVCTYELSTRKVIPLTKGEYPIWNADGSAIYYLSQNGGTQQIHRHAASAGSNAEVILDIPAKRVWPYGDSWLFSHQSESGLWLYHTTTQSMEQIIAGFHPQDAPNWLLLNDEVYFWTRVGIGTQSLTLKRHDLTTGVTTVLMHRSDALPHDYSGFAVHPNLGHILFPAEQVIENKLLPIALPNS